jgi:uncharacterized protein (TIGR03086 family)
MADERATAALIGGVGLLERAITYTLGSLHGVTPDALSRPTPCAEWDLRALLCHLDDSLRALLQAVDEGYVDLEPPAGAAGDHPEPPVGARAAGGDPPSATDPASGRAGDPASDRASGRARGSTAGPAAADPTVAVRGRAVRLLGAWTNADGATISVAGCSLTAAIVSSTGALEIAVHGWDVARARGQHRPIPPSLAAELLDLCPLLVTEAHRPGHFASRVDVPPTASPGDRLVAFLGRDPAPAILET